MTRLMNLIKSVPWVDLLIKSTATGLGVNLPTGTKATQLSNQFVTPVATVESLGGLVPVNTLDTRVTISPLWPHRTLSLTVNRCQPRICSLQTNSLNSVLSQVKNTLVSLNRGRKPLFCFVPFCQLLSDDTVNSAFLYSLIRLALAARVSGPHY